MSLFKTIIKFESAESDPVLAAKLYKKPKDEDDVYKGGGGSGYGSSTNLALRTAFLAAGTGGGS